MKKNKLIVLGLFNILLSSSAFAKDFVQKNPKQTPTPVLMNQFLGQLTALKKYFISESKFVDPKNNLEIASHLTKFSRFAREAHHDPTLSQENFKFSRQVLEEHITDTERVFKIGNKSYARWRLASTISVCMNCHTQVATSNRSFREFGNFKIFSSKFDQAEFLFVTRAYDKANELYDVIIDEYPKNKNKPEQVQTALERQVAYFSRIKKNPTDALSKMKSHQKNKELPEYLHLNIAAWISQFEIWEKQTTFDAKTATDNQIIEYTQKNIEAKWTTPMMAASNPNLVMYLRVSGILYDYLQTHPQSKITAQVLYWLAICDRSIDNTFFYSLADLYLRECITKYPTDPVAKKCLKEYEAEMIFGYTGSSGIHLPAEVSADLDRLKKLVETGGKLEMREN